jgi:beta-galactosidase
MLHALTLVGTTLFFAFTLASVLPAGRKDAGRKTISLDGTWQIAEGALNEMPKRFDRETPVPGLVDVSRLFRMWAGQTGRIRGVNPFWLRRTLAVEGAVPAVRGVRSYNSR